MWEGLWVPLSPSLLLHSSIRLPVFKKLVGTLLSLRLRSLSNLAETGQWVYKLAGEEGKRSRLTV